MRTRILSLDLMENVIGSTGEPEPDNRPRLEAARTILRYAVERELTPRQRDCVRLYYYAGNTEDQVGEALGIDKTTVCRHLQRARKRLAKAVRLGLSAGGRAFD